MEDTFEFREARIVGGDKGAGVGVMDGMRKEGKRNLFGNEGWGITSDEEGLGEVSDVDAWVTADVTPTDGIGVILLTFHLV